MHTIVKPALAIVPLSVLALSLAGCDSPAQEQVDQQAEAIDKSYEAQADVVESLAEGAPEADQQAAEKRADALRDKGEDIKDELKESADKDL